MVWSGLVWFWHSQYSNQILRCWVIRPTNLVTKHSKGYSEPASDQGRVQTMTMTITSGSKDEVHLVAQLFGVLFLAAAQRALICHYAYKSPINAPRSKQDPELLAQFLHDGLHIGAGVLATSWLLHILCSQVFSWYYHRPTGRRRGQRRGVE